MKEKIKELLDFEVSFKTLAIATVSTAALTAIAAIAILKTPADEMVTAIQRTDLGDVVLLFKKGPSMVIPHK